MERYASIGVVMLATEAAHRTYEGLRQAGIGYFRLREGGRLTQPEDSLGVQRTPLEEARFESPSDLRLDFELSIGCERIIFADRQIAFADLTNGGNANSRAAAGFKWGMSAGRVNRITDSVLRRMVRHCGGGCGC